MNSKNTKKTPELANSSSQQRPTDPSLDPPSRTRSRRTAGPEALGRPNLGRHAANCRICSHPKRVEIEEDFIDWKGPTRIAREYRLGNRYSVYRHASALNLYRRRRHNVRAALERMIERVDDVELGSGAIVSAIQMLAKINARGEWVERDERIYLDELFTRMNPDECAAYAQDGTLPRWFQEAIAAAGTPIANGQESDHE
jgi:hypothetical protein